MSRKALRINEEKADYGTIDHSKQSSASTSNNHPVNTFEIDPHPVTNVIHSSHNSSRSIKYLITPSSSVPGSAHTSSRALSWLSQPFRAIDFTANGRHKTRQRGIVDRKRKSFNIDSTLSSNHAGRVCAFCLADNFAMDRLHAFYSSKKRVNVNFYEGSQVLSVIGILDDKSKDKSRFDMFLFSAGVVVLWNITQLKELSLLQELEQFGSSILRVPLDERFLFSIGETTQIEVNSHIILGKETFSPNVDQTAVRLAFSYAIAQSLKLEYFETELDDLIVHTESLPKDLLHTGKIHISRADLYRFVGDLAEINQNVHLNTLDILNAPSIIRDNTTILSYFKTSSAYLDIDQRVSVLERKLGVAHELVKLLWNEHDVAHSQNLTLIVIFLICFSCVAIFAKVVVHHNT